VAGFEEFHEFALNTGIQGRIAIFEVIDLTFEERILFEKFNDAKRRAADCQDIHAAIFVTFDDFGDFSGAADSGDPFGKGEEHTELRLLFQVIFDHLAVSRLKNMQRHFRAGEKDDVQGKQRNAFRPHGSQVDMIAEGRGDR